MEAPMDTHFHHLSELFLQLGLSDDPAAIEQFIHAQGPLPSGTLLADATLWNCSQAQFLREQIAHDADWAEVVDALNALLSQ
jgi:hypothetical protein